MPRALILDPDAEPAWTDLNHPNGVNAAVNKIIDGGVDYAVIYRDRDRHGPGIHLAVGEWSLTNGEPRNDLASRIVRGLGWNYAVHGRCLLMGLNGPYTVDLTEPQWEFLTRVAGKEAAGA